MHPEDKEAGGQAADPVMEAIRGAVNVGLGLARNRPAALFAGALATGFALSSLVAGSARSSSEGVS